MFVDRNYARAADILTEKVDVLHAMAAALMKYETIDAAQIAELIEGKAVSDPDGWEDISDNDGSGKGTSGGRRKRKGDGNSTQAYSDTAGEH